MSEFTYTKGTWQDGHNMPAWNDNEEFIDYLVRVGFSTVSAKFGNEDSAFVEIYEARTGDSFYASVSPTGNSAYGVFLPDFVSYMQFMKDYVSPFAAGGTTDKLEGIADVLGKLFQAEHGHDPIDSCERCNPDEMKRRRDAYRARNNT